MFQTLWIRITATAASSIGCLVLLGCSASERQVSPMPDNAAPVAQEIDPPALEPSTAPGMKAFMDPVTGEMRAPTDAERAAMEQSGSKPSVGQPRSMREEKLRKRGTMVELEGDPQTPMQACTNADGSVVVDHDCDRAPQPEQKPEGNKP